MNGRWANQGRHPTAIVGHPPEDASWSPGDGYFDPIVDTTAILSAYVTVDGGLTKPTYIGARTWLLKRAHVGHDAFVGDDCVLATGCIIGGFATIGNRAKIGLGAIILPHHSVGPGAVIGAGAVVTRNVPAGETWAGNPARKMDALGLSRVPFVGGIGVKVGLGE